MTTETATTTVPSTGWDWLMQLLDGLIIWCFGGFAAAYRVLCRPPSQQFSLPFELSAYGVGLCRLRPQLVRALLFGCSQTYAGTNSVLVESGPTATPNSQS
ncbi:unnamed protein product [Lathyrus oleraceus]